MTTNSNNIMKQYISEMSYPSNFDINKLDDFTKFSQLKKYCDDRLTRIGNGSSRIVYAVDETRVLKIAKNKKGLAQNEVEGSNYWLNDNVCFANIINNDDRHNHWIEMETARKARVADVKRILGVSFKDLVETIMWLAYNNSRNMSRFGTEFINLKVGELTYNKLDEQDGYRCEFINDLESYISTISPSRADVGDYTRLANWGIVKRNNQEQLVIIDFGINEDTYNQYYR